MAVPDLQRELQSARNYVCERYGPADRQWRAEARENIQHNNAFTDTTTHADQRLALVFVKSGDEDDIRKHDFTHESTHLLNPVPCGEISIRQHKELAIEVVATICLAGPAGEEFFFGPGPVTDEGARTDLRMARTYLEPCYPEIMIGAHLQRLHTAAERLVRDARPRIRAIADALMTKTRLSGDEIYELAIRAGKWSGDATALD
jgi:hypothetical protein